MRVQRAATERLGKSGPAARPRRVPEGIVAGFRNLYRVRVPRSNRP